MNSFFIRFLGASLLVLELLTFPGSKHLAKYFADSSCECSLTFSTFASMCRWSTSDILRQPVAILRDSLCVYWVFYSWCRVGLYSKQVPRSWWSISQPPCTSLVMCLSVVPMMYPPKFWGYCLCWKHSLLRSCYAHWMIVRCYLARDHRFFKWKMLSESEPYALLFL